MLLCRSAVGVEDRVVPAASAAALASFSKTEYLNKNHRSICKAPDRDDPTYQLLRRFLDESVERIPLRERERTMRDLTQKLRRTSRTRGWVRAEQEHITLAPGDSSRMRCKVRNVRIGGLAKRRFNFCVWLPGQFPAARPVDYGWEIGQGILDQATFKHLSGSLRERFDELFQVNMIRIDQDGNSDGYHLSRREDDPGWVMLEFDSPNWVVEGQLYDKLEIELESWVDRGQGWYFYEAPRAIAGHLEVKLVAPFEAIPIANLGRSTTIEQTIPVGSSYLHTVTADGPIAPGNNLVWVFPANRNAGDRPHSPGDS
jgi:hypothetical protein